ncbi:uncharacterized protein LOC131236536 isoform X2 [Magnolia sinica]|uniref:uncharacterized protein LOC131236536 isoform X2 n=1 Tax=Magnolia sinica TaxID=86752 RepID=UPI00265AA0B7|nr:uncharacterized protein LOC131236536 isoform X2 [Magnolia sinica]
MKNDSCHSPGWHPLYVNNGWFKKTGQQSKFNIHEWSTVSGPAISFYQVIFMLVPTHSQRLPGLESRLHLLGFQQTCLSSQISLITRGSDLRLQLGIIKNHFIDARCPLQATRRGSPKWCLIFLIAQS